jgi:hypothetical protein
MPAGYFDRTKWLKVMQSPEYREKMRIRSTGRKHSKDTKRQMSLRQIGKIIPLEQREKTGQTLRKPVKYFVDKNGCWICTSHPFSIKGYPIISVLQHRMSVGRYMYEQKFGKIKNGLFACHKCDVPACINPDHIFLGTHLDNMNDMCQKGRQHIFHGESHPMAKLNNEQVLAIRSDNRSQRQIAHDYGVDQALVQLIKARKIWKHI